MKKYSWFCIALIIGFTSSCRKSSNNCSLKSVKIIRFDCDRVIVQLPDGYGDASWTDVTTGIRYTNIASCSNSCLISSATNGEPGVYYIDFSTVNSGNTLPGCNQCLAVSPNPPQSIIDITYIGSAPCKNSL